MEGENKNKSHAQVEKNEFFCALSRTLTPLYFMTPTLQTYHGTPNIYVKWLLEMEVSICFIVFANLHFWLCCSFKICCSYCFILMMFVSW